MLKLRNVKNKRKLPYVTKYEPYSLMVSISRLNAKSFRVLRLYGHRNYSPLLASMEFQNQSFSSQLCKTLYAASFCTTKYFTALKIH